MKNNPLAAMTICLAAFLIGIVIFTGCVKQKEQEPLPRETATVVKEGDPTGVTPFPRILDAAKGSVSGITAGNLERLFLPGLAILLIAVIARFIFGSWRDSFVVSGLGLIPSIGGVLLSEYPNVVLLVPAAAAAVGIAYGVKRIFEWWTGYRCWVATSSIIEEGDTGPTSWGQRIKDRFKATGWASLLDKGVRLMEKIWAKRKPEEPPSS